MTEVKPLLVLQESKFIVIDEDSKATYADHLVAGYVQTLLSPGSTEYHPDHKAHLLLFISPGRFYDYLLGIIGEDNLTVHDYFSPDINEFWKGPRIALDPTSMGNALGDKSIVIVNCLSSLILTIGLAKATRFVEKLASRVGQLICIFNRDVCVEGFPSIETLGTTYVQLNRCQSTVINNDITYEVSMTYRKTGGSIWRKTLLAIQDTETYELKFEKLPVIVPKLEAPTPKPTIKPQATFRIDMNARELEQRNKTPLPYILNSDAPNESKILYVPDDVDDFDEEDPDDDLPF